MRRVSLSYLSAIYEATRRRLSIETGSRGKQLAWLCTKVKKKHLPAPLKLTNVTSGLFNLYKNTTTVAKLTVSWLQLHIYCTDIHVIFHLKLSSWSDKSSNSKCTANTVNLLSHHWQKNGQKGWAPDYSVFIKHNNAKFSIKKNEAPIWQLRCHTVFHCWILLTEELLFP